MLVVPGDMTIINIHLAHASSSAESPKQLEKTPNTAYFFFICFLLYYFLLSYIVHTYYVLEIVFGSGHTRMNEAWFLFTVTYYQDRLEWEGKWGNEEETEQ